MPRPSKKIIEEKAKAMPMPNVMQTVVPAHTTVPNPGSIIHSAPIMPGAPAAQQRVVDNDSFLRVRDSAVGRLSTILELLRSFINDYIRQTNLLLGDHAEGSQIDLNAFDNVAAQLIPSMMELGAAVPEKKKRRRRTHDPAAPKRPLTPHFLYMQFARPIIFADLGPDCPRGAVQEEGQRRWATMAAEEKNAWYNAYEYNLRLYNARAHAYKQGNMHAKDMSDDEALKYADEKNIPLREAKGSALAETSVDDQDAIAEQLQQAISASSDEEGDGMETMVKTPRKAGSGRKRKVATPAAADMDASQLAAAASPDKKRRRVSGKPAGLEEPKKSGRKKTAKSS